MIKTVIFDLNKTIVSYKSKNTLLDEFMQNYNLNPSEFELTKNPNFQKYLFGEISLQELHSTTLEDKDVDLYESMEVDMDRFELTYGIKTILTNLSKKYELVLLAKDGMESLNYKLNKFDLGQYFSKVYCTCFEKLEKNDPKYYELIIKNSECNADEILFIDDKKENLDVAKSLKIKTIQFSDIKQLKKDLTKALK